MTGTEMTGIRMTARLAATVFVILRGLKHESTFKPYQDQLSTRKLLEALDSRHGTPPPNLVLRQGRLFLGQAKVRA